MPPEPSYPPPHRQLLETLRRAFPQPVSDPVHDAYFVYSIARALDQVDALKSQAPILGAPTSPDYAAARQSQLAEDGRATESVIPELVSYLNGMFIWGHPRSQVNVVPNPSIASIIGVAFCGKPEWPKLSGIAPRAALPFSI